MSLSSPVGHRHAVRPVHVGSRSHRIGMTAWAGPVHDAWAGCLGDRCTREGALTMGPSIRF